MDTILLCLKVLDELRRCHAQLKENHATCARLCERAELFRELLENLKGGGMASNISSCTIGLVGNSTAAKSLEQLKETLVDINAFQKKFNQEGMINSFIKIAFRKEHAADIAALNARLNDCVLTFLPTYQVDAEQQRQEDMQDFKDFFEASVHRLMDDISLQSQGSDDQFIRLQNDITENRASLKEIMKILQHRPLTQSELISEETNMGRLAELADERHKEVMRKLSELSRNIVQIKSLLMNMESGMEKQHRDEILSGRQLSRSNVEVTAEVIGAGEFGTVHVGRYNNTAVAVKRVRDHCDEGLLKALESELILMYLIDNHPNILTVYGYLKNAKEGVQVVMELSPYGSLASMLYNKEKYPDIPVLLSLSWLCDVASALAHLHDRQVKHRDVKAENVLLFHGYHAKLCDFGLAKQHVSKTKSKGSAVGTIPFIAPEVLSRKGCFLSSDIYSWAIMAVQIFSRQHPSEDESDTDLIDKCLLLVRPKLKEDFDRLQKLLKQCILFDYRNLDKPDDLRPMAAVVYRRLKNIMLQNGGTDNYRDNFQFTKANTVIDDSFEKEKQALQTQLDHSKAAADAAIAEKMQLEAQLNEIKSQQEADRLKIASEKKRLEEIAEHNHKVAIAVEQKKLEADEVLRHRLEDINKDFTGACLSTFAGHSNTVWGVCVSGSKGDQYLYSCSGDSSIKKWDITTGACLLTFNGHSKPVYRVCVSSNDGGKYMYSGSYDSSIKKWDAATGTCVLTFNGHASYVRSISMNSIDGGKFVYSGSNDNTIKKWDTSSGKCLLTLTGHTSCVTSVYINDSDGGQYLYSGSYDNTVKKWSIATGVCVLTFSGHSQYVHSVCVSSDGKFVYSGSFDHSVKKWDAMTGACLLTFSGHSSEVMDVCVSSTNQYVYSCSRDKTIKKWNTANGDCVSTLTSHSEAVTSICVSSSNGGNYLYSGSWDNMAKKWEA